MLTGIYSFLLAYFSALILLLVFQKYLLFHPKVLPVNYNFVFNQPHEEIWLHTPDGEKINSIRIKTTEKQTKAIETAAQKVLDARLEFPNSSLADLYNPLTMPPTLIKAHNDLDKAVDLAYRPQPFASEAKRMEFLFELYEKYTADLFTKEKVKKKRTKSI